MAVSGMANSVFSVHTRYLPGGGTKLWLEKFSSGSAGQYILTAHTVCQITNAKPVWVDARSRPQKNNKTDLRISDTNGNTTGEYCAVTKEQTIANIMLLNTSLSPITINVKYPN